MTGWARSPPVISMRAPATTAPDWSATVPEMVSECSSAGLARQSRNKTILDRTGKCSDRLPIRRRSRSVFSGIMCLFDWAVQRGGTSGEMKPPGSRLPAPVPTDWSSIILSRSCETSKRNVTKFIGVVVLEHSKFVELQSDHTRRLAGTRHH